MSILSKYCANCNIVLHKGDNLHILGTLLWNWALLLKLKLHKMFRKIRRPIVHYYAVCWNEEKILPFMFDYYGCFVDQFTIYDNCSSDRSSEIILSHKNAQVITFTTEGFNDNIHINIKNNCWKRSRGKADYVIVCDIDEFIFHKDIKEALAQLEENGYSIVKPFGYNMYSRDYPAYIPNQLLTDLVKQGVRVPMFDKCILFDPHALVEINYKPGAHECHPWGRVKKYRNEDFKLLHYKNIGLVQLLERNQSYVMRLSKENIENNYGIEYLKKEQFIIQEFDENEQKAEEII